MSELARSTPGWKSGMMWSGLGAVVLTWAITLYWTLVSYRYLDTPWGMQ